MKLRRLLITLLVLAGINSNAQIGWFNTDSIPSNSAHDYSFVAYEFADSTYGLAGLDDVNSPSFVTHKRVNFFGSTLQLDRDSLYSLNISNIQAHPMPNGNLLIARTIEELVGIRDLLFAMYDQNGDTLWTKKAGRAGANEWINAMIPSGSGFVITGLLDTAILVMKVDQNLDTVYIKSYSPGGYQYMQGTAIVENGAGYAILGTIGTGASAGTYLVQCDANGDTLWSRFLDRRANWTSSYGLTNLTATSDGGFIMTGQVMSTGVGTRSVVVKTNALGDTLWTIDHSGYYHALDIYELPGSRYISGTSTGFPFHPVLFRLDNAGNIVGLDTLALQGAPSVINSFILTSDMHCLLGGTHNYNKSLLIKADTLGQVINSVIDGNIYLDYDQNCVKDLSNPAVNQAFQVQLTGSGGSWTTNTFPNGDFRFHVDTGNYTVQFIPPSGDWSLPGCGTSTYNTTLLNYGDTAQVESPWYHPHIKGNVYKDEDANCIWSAGDYMLHNWIVEANGQQTWYGSTDTAGFYLIPVPLGNYQVDLIEPNYMWQTTCSINQNISLTGGSPEAVLDYPVDPVYDCPYMEVDLSIWGIRRCNWNNNFVISYCNNGTDTAYNAYVEVTFDSLVAPQFSTLMWETPQTGNTYQFLLGDMAPGECDVFYVTAYVNCDSTVLGQVLCNQAYIYPDTFCGQPSPLWDGSDIRAEAVCLGDSVRLTLRNVGTGDMSIPLVYYVTEDNLMLTNGTFDLNAGEHITHKFEANGSFYYIEGRQSAEYPYAYIPSAGVEGCGTDSAGNFTMGLIDNLPADDGAHYLDIDCQEIIGSYDPNDKTPSPAGWGAQHFITDSTDMEYRIRFQNTGTDTAFNIVILDTLPPYLDVSTVVSGASSHYYEFEIYGQGILKWTFPNIMLPDSFVDEPASNGFVKFRVKQTANNPLGTVIENRAAIYFDFNEPVITNTAWNTIGEDFILFQFEEIAEPGYTFNAYPNPFREETTIAIEGKTADGAILHVFDLQGKSIRSQPFGPDGRVIFKRNNLEPGINLFRIEADGQLIGHGKLIVH